MGRDTPPTGVADMVHNQLEPRIFHESEPLSPGHRSAAPGPHTIGKRRRYDGKLQGARTEAAELVEKLHRVQPNSA